MSIRHSDLFYTQSESQGMSEDEMWSEMQSTFRLAGQAANERFPEFLFEPMITEFEGDCYRERGVMNDSLSRDVRQLRKKYANYFDYLDALDIYYAYMSGLIETYGTLDILLSGSREGFITDYIPGKPKLKKRKENRALLESNVVPSRKDAPKLSPEHLKEVVDTTMKDVSDPPGDISFVSMMELPKPIRKLFKRGMKKEEILTRRRNIYSEYGQSSSEVDAILNFIHGEDSGDYTRDGKYRGDQSISEIYEEQHRWDGYPDYYLELMESDKGAVVGGGRLISSEKEHASKLMIELFKLGYNIDGVTQNMDKEAVRMIRRATAPLRSGPMSEKELKKLKKRQKKEAKKRKEMSMQDAAMNEILLNNRAQFGDSYNSSLTFQLRDLYPGE